MAYFTPYIDNKGIHVPTYQDIIDYYIAKAKDIFGAEIYLGEDSKDYQLISIIARAAASALQAAVDSYNARDPDTTFDDALDGIVTINGIQRKPSTYSTVEVTLTGIPYTVIQSGVVKSNAGDQWDLPTEVILDGSGNALVTATAQEKGPIVALPNTITTIVTPTYGWYTVNNLSAASEGQPAETTPALKARRKIAVATPSITPLGALEAEINNVLGVTDFKIYENDTKVTDSRGLPGNSITAVVEGGTTSDIAEAIARKKNMGVLSYGDVHHTVVTQYGGVLDIGFFRPISTNVYITLNIKALTGYTSIVGDEIKQAIINYLNSMSIGDNLYNSQVYEAALSVSPDLKPYFSIDPVEGILIGTSDESQAKQDLEADYKQKYTSNEGIITINLVGD